MRIIGATTIMIVAAFKVSPITRISVKAAVPVALTDKSHCVSNYNITKNYLKDILN